MKGHVVRQVTHDFLLVFNSNYIRHYLALIPRYSQLLVTEIVNFAYSLLKLYRIDLVKSVFRRINCLKCDNEKFVSDCRYSFAFWSRSQRSFSRTGVKMAKILFVAPHYF